MVSKRQSHQEACSKHTPGQVWRSGEACQLLPSFSPSCDGSQTSASSTSWSPASSCCLRARGHLAQPRVDSTKNGPETTVRHRGLWQEHR